jgi:hypothetical protein
LAAWNLSMSAAYVVSPFDGGWCLKIASTGEVMFFQTGGEAERRAKALASLDPKSEIWVHGRDGRLIGRWTGGGRLPTLVHLLTDEPAPFAELAA